MKHPKEPKTFKYPRLYWRSCRKRDIDQGVQRLRIIYPDGRVSWGDDVHMNNEFSCWSNTSPCWTRFTVNEPLNLVQKMKEYDKKYGYKTVFLGEIK